MIKNFYIYKNNKLGVFNDPFYSPYSETEIKELIERGCKSGQIEHFEELSLFKIFTMDDKTAEIKEKLEFILDLAQFNYKEEAKNDKN